MTKISSAQTWFYKRVLPAFWFGLPAVMFIVFAFSGVLVREPIFVVWAVAFATVGFILFKRMFWNLLDEVYDCGDSLLVRNQGEEDSIALSNVMNVSVTTHTNLPRIALRLVTPSRFGSELTFSPVRKFTLDPFAKNKVAEDLMVRVDQARLRRVR